MPFFRTEKHPRIAFFCKKNSGFFYDKIPLEKRYGIFVYKILIY